MSNIMVWAKDGMVSVGAMDGTVYALSPAVAVQLAQSLMRKAKEADPYIDVTTVSDAYRDTLNKEVH